MDLGCSKVIKIEKFLKFKRKVCKLFYSKNKKSRTRVVPTKISYVNQKSKIC